MIDAARRMVATFGQLDPGAGCWQFIQRYKPDLWRSHTQAIRDNDISRAASTFKAMLAAWDGRHQAEQGVLL